MRILVTGAGGQVGREILAELSRRQDQVAHGSRLEVVATDHAHLDVISRDQVMAAIVQLEPDVVIHPAAWTAVDACEEDPAKAYAVNSLGTRHVAEAALLVGAHVCYLSTDYVFDGTLERPYTEWDRPNPQSVYGRSKLGGERELAPEATIVRTAWVCGRYGTNMAKTVLQLAGDGGVLRFVADQEGSPTMADDLAGVVVRLALERRRGIFHVTNQGSTSWFGFARAVLELAGEDPGRAEPIMTSELDPPRAAPRPANSVLDNSALALAGDPLLPDWRDSLGRLVADLRA